MMEIPTQREVTKIERWMASRKARAATSKVKRCLFAPITPEDRKRTAEHIATMTALTDHNAKRTYNFDFAADKPLSAGRFQWEIAESAPMPYNSRLFPTGRNFPAPTTTTCTTSSLSRTALDFDCSPRVICDMNVDTTQDSTVPAAPIHDSGVFSDQEDSCCSEDEENAAASTSTSASPTPRTSSPRQQSPQRRRTIPDYFRQRKPKVLRVKRLQ